VLRYLGTVSSNQFAEVFEIPRLSATGVIDRLEECGLVKRALDPADRWVITVQLTPRGQTALEDPSLFDRNPIRDRISSLGPDEQRLLADLLELVVGESVLPEAPRRAVDDRAR
jgi:DNA-binding MarR family transcriptional regulator